ncbi:6-phosphogluconolactonase [Lysobacter sp. TY2-98]|uniref:6-phosphogluconolactonase n=1 Tax=Lysobacter sp. TY2-98 TaxID=2290922 RepID=UPI000E203367|nr:6-phosphogluconolactonase [Lysobacter sp. TY2-98]AXK73366.1 6-phosphogluconolactonase [Lysobacter sp. TY2-98]
MAWVEHTYDNSEALAIALAQTLGDAVEAALDTRGHAMLALAGGRTPLPAYRALASRWRHDVRARRIVLMPTDDRCVPHDHPNSNVGELRAIFDGTPVRVESLTTADGDAERSVHYAHAMLADHRDDFDAVVLGMGADAHFASLFPGARQLAEGLDPASMLGALRVDPDPLPVEAPFPRMSLTFARLLRSRAIHLAVTGEAKRNVLQAAYADADASMRPVAALLHAPERTAHVHWSP